MKTIMIFLTLLASQLAFADIGAPSYVVSAKERREFEQAVKKSMPDVQSVVCKDLIQVATGGTLGTATAGVCILDGQEGELNCRNNMLGTIGSALRLNLKITLESELRQLIDQQCTGG